MRKFGRAGLVAGVALAMLAVPVATASVAGAAGSKEVSDSKYVKIVCSSLGGSQKTFLADLKALPSGGADLAGFQTAAVAAAQKLSDSLTAAQAKLKKIQPSDGGKSVAKTFNAFYAQYIAKVQDAINKFKSADPNGVAFQADVTQFRVAFQTLDATTGDPFSKVKDQALISAFGKDKSCKSVVNVYGG